MFWTSKGLPKNGTRAFARFGIVVDINETSTRPIEGLGPMTMTTTKSTMSLAGTWFLESELLHCVDAFMYTSLSHGHGRILSIFSTVVVGTMALYLSKNKRKLFSFVRGVEFGAFLSAYEFDTHEHCLQGLQRKSHRNCEICRWVISFMYK